MTHHALCRRCEFHEVREDFVDAFVAKARHLVQSDHHVDLIDDEQVRFDRASELTEGVA